MKRISLYVCASVFVLCSSAHAQERGWVDVNFGAAGPATSREARSIEFTLFAEEASFGTDYEFNPGGHFNVGGGFLLHPMFGLGVNVGRSTSQGPPTITATIPHPLIFNAFDSDTAVGDTDVTRAELGVHFSLVVNAFPRSPRVSLKIFAGPSYYRVTQENVADFNYDQVYLVFLPVNTIDILTYEIQESKGSGWGVHGGVDVATYFTRNVGIGGGFKVASANVPLEDLVGEYDSSAGGPSFYGGLRLRY